MNHGTGSPRGRRKRRLRAVVTVGLITAALTLLVAAAALAARPKSGKYKGATSAAKVVGFIAPVTFKATGSKLTGLAYGTVGCFGAGGFKPGVTPYKNASLIKVGTIPVSASGKFSIKGAKSTYRFKSSGTSLVTTSTISGRFTSAGAASGTIRFTQTYKFKQGQGQGQGQGHPTCTATKPLSFEVKLA